MKHGGSNHDARARRKLRGAALLEQLVLLAVALLGLIGFSRFGTALHEQLDQESEHIRGRGTPGSDLSLGALAGSYQPLPAAGVPLPAPTGSRPGGPSSAPRGSALPGARPPAPAASSASSASPSASGNGAAPAGSTAARPGAGSASSSGTSSSSASSSSSGPSSSSAAPSTTGGGSGRSSSKPDLMCGDSGRYKFDLGAGSESKKAPRVPDGSNLQRDHIPQGKALTIRAEQLLAEQIRERVRAEMSSRCRHLTEEEEANIEQAVLQEANAAILKNLSEMVENNGFTVALPEPVHVNGRTYGNSSLPPRDAADLGRAARRDMKRYLSILDAEEADGNITRECADRLRAVFAERMARTTEQYEAELMKSVLLQLKKKSSKVNAALEQRLKEEEKCE